MAKAKSVTLRAQEAVVGSSMPSDVRHVVHVLATIAKRQTGIGWAGQETIARSTGLSERHVRGVLRDLEARTDWPVKLKRRPRFRPEGRGRTSDEWRIILRDQPAPPAGYSDDQPAPSAGKTPGLTGTPCTTNRHATSDQPAPGAGDPGRDPGRDPGSTPASTGDAGSFALSHPSEKTRAQKARRPPKKPKASPEDGRAHQAVIDHYSEAYERARHCKPDISVKNAAAAKTLRKKFGIDETLKIIDRAFADEWFVENSGDLSFISSKVNKYRGTQPVPAKRMNGARPMQPNHPGGTFRVADYEHQD